jgi:hypothetical protein
MFICPECGCLFEEAARFGEVHNELDEKAIEYFSCCPNCGDLNFEEAVRCDYCEEEFREDDLIGGTLCKDCLEEIISARQDVVKAYILTDREAFADFVHYYDGPKTEVSEE